MLRKCVVNHCNSILITLTICIAGKGGGSKLAIMTATVSIKPQFYVFIY